MRGEEGGQEGWRGRGEAIPHLPASGPLPAGAPLGSGGKDPFQRPLLAQEERVSQVPRARPERGSNLQGLAVVDTGSQVSPLHTWAQESLRPGLCWRADPGPCLPCIISLAS